MKTSTILFPAALAALIAVSGGLSARQDPHAEKPGAVSAAKPDKSQEDRAVIQTQRWSYPLATCPISGEKLGAKMSEFVVQGRLVRTCCNDCKAQVVQDPAPILKKIDAAVVAAQKADYPLATCPVTGAKLDDKAVDHVYGTRLVRLANRDAVAAFEKDPKPAMTLVDAAYVKALTTTYPLKTCVVSGEDLGAMGETCDKLYGTRLVRFCCSSCTASFEKEPAAYLKKIDDARKPAK
jgi:hypothetical protein